MHISTVQMYARMLGPHELGLVLIPWYWAMSSLPWVQKEEREHHRSLNYYSFCRWIINWNSRGGYKVLRAEKDRVSCQGLALQLVIKKKKKRKGQIKWEIACITWMIKPSTSVLKCVWFLDVLLCWMHFFFLSASFISPLEREAVVDDRIMQIWWQWLL